VIIGDGCILLASSKKGLYYPIYTDKIYKIGEKLEAIELKEEKNMEKGLNNFCLSSLVELENDKFIVETFKDFYGIHFYIKEALEDLDSLKGHILWQDKFIGEHFITAWDSKKKVFEKIVNPEIIEYHFELIKKLKAGKFKLKRELEFEEEE
jgi:hypothetical protein